MACFLIRITVHDYTISLIMPADKLLWSLIELSPGGTRGWSYTRELERGATAKQTSGITHQLGPEAGKQQIHDMRWTI